MSLEQLTMMLTRTEADLTPAKLALKKAGPLKAFMTGVTHTEKPRTYLCHRCKQPGHKAAACRAPLPISDENAEGKP
eukprot:263604-Chlamydomonas_euryale.AAC.1